MGLAQVRVLGQGLGPGPSQGFEGEQLLARPALGLASEQGDDVFETGDLIEALKSLDVNALTPIEALTRLYELRQMALDNQ